MPITMKTLERVLGDKFDPEHYNYACIKHRDWAEQQHDSGLEKVGEVPDSASERGTLVVVARRKPEPPKAPESVAQPKATPAASRSFLRRFKRN